MRMIRIQRSIQFAVASLGLAVAVACLTGCATAQRMAEGHPSRTAGQYKDDKKIQSTIEAALLKDPVYKYPDVTVNVYRGQVAMSGFVITEPQKEEAVRVARGTQGVTGVDDKLVIAHNPGIPVVGQTAPLSEQPQPNEERPK